MSKRSGEKSSFKYAQSILDIFVLQGVLDYEDAEKLKKNLKTNREVENFLLVNKIVTKDTINKAYSILLKIPFISLSGLQIPDQAKLILGKPVAERFRIIVFGVEKNVLKVAVSQPSDLWSGFNRGLLKLLKLKDIKVELFITGESDFKEALSQYTGKKNLLLKRGSYPVVYLRGYNITKHFLEKLPFDFVKKYRLLVFGLNVGGNYMIACQDPNSPLTKKLITYLEKENKVKFELYAAARDDFEYVIEHWYDIEGEETSADSKQDDEIEKVEETPILQQTDKHPAAAIPFSIDSISFDKKKTEPLPKVNLGDLTIDQHFYTILPKDLVRKHRVAIFGQSEGKLLVATDTPEAVTTKKTIEFIKKQHKVKVFLASTEEIENYISKIK